MIKLILILLVNGMIFGLISLGVQLYYDIPDFTFGLRINVLVWTIYGVVSDRLYLKYKHLMN